jgi:cytochrome c biogenesis protein CcdA
MFDYTPYITFSLGLLLVPAGIAMVAGRDLKMPAPRLQAGGDSPETLSMFLFGISYASVSLGCTIGLFIAGVSSVFTTTGFVDGVAVFVVYGLGMGAVIMTLTIGLALARTSIAHPVHTWSHNSVDHDRVRKI